jgi:hypothetical protein
MCLGFFLAPFRTDKEPIRGSPPANRPDGGTRKSPARPPAVGCATLKPLPEALRLVVHRALTSASRPRLWATVDRYRPVGYSAVPAILTVAGARRREGEHLEPALCDLRRGAADAPSLEAFERRSTLQAFEGHELTNRAGVSSVNPYYEPRTIKAIGLAPGVSPRPIDTITKGEVCAAS